MADPEHTQDAEQTVSADLPDDAVPASLESFAAPPAAAEDAAPAETQTPSPEDATPAEVQAPDAEAPPAPPAEIHAHHIRTVDFSQPTKFTAEMRRRIMRVVTPFCESLSLRLSTEMRAPVEISVADASQLTWAAAKARLSANTIAVAVGVQPIDRQMLLCVEPPFVLQALECLLGGAAAQADVGRHFSEVDWALTRRLLGSMIGQLGPAWRDLGGLELSLGEIDLEGDAGVLVPTGEPTFALTLDTSVDALPSSMALLIPWAAVGPVADAILGAGLHLHDADSHEARAMHHGLAGAHVCLRAEVGAREMPVERMLALTPGTLLTLSYRADSGVRLFAEGVPLGRALPGLRGARRAVKLIEAAGPGAVDPFGHPGGGPAEQPAYARAGLARMMDVPVRVWAELGRTSLSLGEALGLPPGSVVELDQTADAPIELFVNGTRFADGTLQVAADGEWAVQIDALV
jgi:flagellar motor switch protein FliM